MKRKSTDIGVGPGGRVTPWRARLLTAAVVLPALAASVLVTSGAASAGNQCGWAEGVGAATASYSAQDLAVVAVQDIDLCQQRFYFQSVLNGSTPDGLQEVPGKGAGAGYLPAVARALGKNYVVVVGSDQKLWIQVAYDEWGYKSWNKQWLQVPGGLETRADPKIAYLAATQEIIITAHGTNGSLYWQKQNTATNVWSGWHTTQLPVPLKANRGVAVTELNGKPVFALAGADQKIYVGQLFSSSGVSWTKVPGIDGDTTPGLAVTGKNVLNVVYRGINKTPGLMYYQSAVITGNFNAANPPAWRSSWTEVPGNGNFAPSVYGSGPTVSRSFAGNLHIYYRGTDGAQWTTSLGNTVPGSTTLGLTEGAQGWKRVAGLKPVPMPTPPTPTPTPPPTPNPPPPPTPIPPPVPAKKADLLWSGAPTVNDNKNVELTFKNGGTLAAGPFRVSAMVGFAEIDQWAYSELGVGASKVQTIATGGFPAGSYTLNMVLDSYTAVAESNENNNGKSVTFTKYPNGEVEINN